MTTSQCAVGPDGTLLDASKIQWFHDADDEHPFPPVSSSVSVPPESGTVAFSEPEVHPFFGGRGLLLCSSLARVDLLVRYAFLPELRIRKIQRL
jgi:hypothetical protein